MSASGRNACEALGVPVIVALREVYMVERRTHSTERLIQGLVRRNDAAKCRWQQDLLEQEAVMQRVRCTSLLCVWLQSSDRNYRVFISIFSHGSGRANVLK